MKDFEFFLSRVRHSQVTVPCKAWCLWHNDCSSSIQTHFFKHIKATELSSQNGNNTFHWRKLLLESSYSLHLLLKWCKKIRVISKLWIFVVVLTVKTGTGVGAGDPLGSRANHTGLTQAGLKSGNIHMVCSSIPSPQHRNARTLMPAQLLRFKHNLAVVIVFPKRLMLSTEWDFPLPCMCTTGPWASHSS